MRFDGVSGDWEQLISGTLIADEREKAVFQGEKDVRNPTLPAKNIRWNASYATEDRRDIIENDWLKQASVQRMSGYIRRSSSELMHIRSRGSDRLPVQSKTVFHRSSDRSRRRIYELRDNFSLNGG